MEFNTVYGFKDVIGLRKNWSKITFVLTTVTWNWNVLDNGVIPGLHLTNRYSKYKNIWSSYCSKKLRFLQVKDSF